ncbi:MAG: type II secretion system F family protein [Deltaproteobacteria bacterium]|nr:type II secretion system F family protein [Deltaproteobacteria bacterium]
MELIITMGIFVVTVMLVEGVYLAIRAMRNPEWKRVKTQLNLLSSQTSQEEALDIERKKILSQVPWLDRMLWRVPKIRRLERIREQAHTEYPLGFFILIAMILAVLGFFLGSITTSAHWLFRLPGAAFLGALPFLYLTIKRKRRMEKFERQLPDALDLIVQALRAGHAFTTGLKMVAEEFKDPLGPEFDRTLGEVNFGININRALKNLLNRLDCPDLRFFVMSILLQRETGGNLAEILGNISRLMRERFKFQGKVRTLSAEGRLSAILLIALPFFVVFVLIIIRPEYIGFLATDPIGRILSAVSMVFMALGVIVMKKMIAIRV